MLFVIRLDATSNADALMRWRCIPLSGIYSAAPLNSTLLNDLLRDTPVYLTRRPPFVEPSDPATVTTDTSDVMAIKRTNGIGVRVSISRIGSKTTPPERK